MLEKLRVSCHIQRLYKIKITIYEYNNYNKYYHTYCAFVSALMMKLTSLTALLVQS